MNLLEVAVDVPINKTFTYLPLENINPNDLVGKRVKVPFGKKILTGYVLSIGASPAQQRKNEDSQIPLFEDIISHKLKRILEVIDDQPIINSETIRLAQYISQNYICSIGEALSCAAACSMQKPKKRQIEKQRERQIEKRKEEREKTETDERQTDERQIEKRKEKKRKDGNSRNRKEKRGERKDGNNRNRREKRKKRKYSIAKRGFAVFSLSSFLFSIFNAVSTSRF